MTEQRTDTASRSSTETRGGTRHKWQRFLPIALLAAGLVAFYMLGWHEYISLAALREHRGTLIQLVAQYGVWSGVIFAAMYMLTVSFSVPGGALLTIIGGFLFGPWIGTLWVVIGATLGATVLFLAARYAFADLFRARTGAALNKMKDGFNKDAFSYILVLRLVPLFPFWLVNLVPSLLNVKLRTYVIGTFVGIIPGTFVYALVGDGLGAVLDAGEALDLGIIFKAEILAPICGLALLALIPIIYRRIKGRRAASPDISELAHDPDS